MRRTSGKGSGLCCLECDALLVTAWYSEELATATHKRASSIVTGPETKRGSIVSVVELKCSGEEYLFIVNAEEIFKPPKSRYGMRILFTESEW